jgi:hypothetical protein
VRERHIDNQLWSRFPIKNHNRSLVRHGWDMVLSETCERTWILEYGRPRVPDEEREPRD